MAARKSNDFRQQKRDNSRFEWEKLPLEVYETLVIYLDGSSLMNLCLSSCYIASRVLEPFAVLSHQKREKHWHNFCIAELDRSFVYKIFSSFVDGARYEELVQKENESALRCMALWENVFHSYTYYWHLLTTRHPQTQRLNEFENKLKAEMLCVTAAEATNSTNKDDFKYFTPSTKKYSWIIRSGGGKIISNVMLPCPSNHTFNRLNLVVTEVSENINCIHQSTLCSRSTAFFGVKTMHFPIIQNENGNKVLNVDRILLSACNDCITITPLLGGVTRKMMWPEQRMEDGSLDDIEGCSVFEVKENVMVLWPRPKTLVFFLVITSPNQEGYEFTLLYTLRLNDMDILWDYVLRYPSHYLTDIQMISGTTPRMSRHANDLVVGESEYFYHPSKPVYYGLELISPIHGVWSFKPSSGSNDEVIIEHLEPKYLHQNSKKFLSCMQDPKCSGKGYGWYVFCSNTAIAVSKNAKDWIFGALSFPTLIGTGNAENAITHVEVVHYNNGLLLVVNQDIILAEMCVQIDSSGLSERIVTVKSLRIFQTTLASLCKEISHIELNFDNGRPFLLVVAKQQTSSLAKDEIVLKKVQKEFSFAVMRIEFNDDF